MPLIAAVVVGMRRLGLGAGALLSGGGDDGDKDDKQPDGRGELGRAARSPEAPADDPAKPQAEELDKLLADSNNSRDAVISAVSRTIKTCNEPRPGRHRPAGRGPAARRPGHPARQR